MANKFQSSAKHYTSSNKFIDDYEKLLKKNTGSSLLFAQDTGFNPAYNLTNQQVVAPEVQGGLSSPQMSTNRQPAQPAQREYAPLPEATAPQAQQEYQPSEQELPENPSPQQMLEAIFKAAWEPELPSSEELEQRYQETGEAYAIQSMADGTVRYNDGSVRSMAPDEPPMPIASMRDGTVLWSDGFTREMPAQGLSGYLAGVNGLSEFIFGQDQTVTQEYGNYNPGLGYANDRHRGVDFRTRDLQNRNLLAPVQMTVVKVIGEESGSQYGNSVLLQLPSGEMLRLSHLSQLGQFQEGQVLQPGEVIGVPGSTGNSNAEHLDVEYYNTDGQVDNPNNFKQNAQQYSISNQITGTSPYQNQSMSPATQPTQQAPQTQAQPQQEQMPEFTSPLFDTAKQVAQTVAEPVQKAGETVANYIDQKNRTGKLGIGVTELLRGDVKGAKSEVANTINTLQPTGAFDTGLTEGGNTPLAEQARLNTVMTGSAGQTNPIRYFVGNVAEKIGDAFGIPEGAGSEFLAGTQTRRSNIANADNGNYQSLPQSPFQGDSYSPNLLGDAKRAVDYTKQKAGNLISTAAKSVDDYADKVTAKAGQGVSQLKQGVADIAQNIFKKPQAADIGAKKLIGEDGSQGENLAPSSLLDMNKVGGQNDNRDAFFKYGGADTYKDFLNPGVDKNYRGALNFNLFKDSVFDSMDAVGNIFGSTYLGKEATDKYRSRETAKYPQMSYSPKGYEGLIDYQDGYDRGEVDRYNAEVRKNYDNYNNQVRSQTDQYNKSITDYIGSIPSVIAGANWQVEAPKSAKNAFAQASLQTKTPISRVEKSLMSMAPMSVQPSLMSTSSISKPTAKPTINTNLMSVAKPQMSVNKPQMSVVSISKPQMSVARPSVSAPPQQSNMPGSSAPQMSVMPQKSVPQMSYAKPYTPAPKAAPRPAQNSSNSSMRNQPYAIQSLANGKVKYSDGSIRNR